MPRRVEEIESSLRLPIYKNGNIVNPHIFGRRMKMRFRNIWLATMALTFFWISGLFVAPLNAVENEPALQDGVKTYTHITSSKSKKNIEGGDEHFALGHFDEAIKLYKKAADFDPNNADAYLKLSQAFASKGEALCASAYKRYANGVKKYGSLVAFQQKPASSYTIKDVLVNDHVSFYLKNGKVARGQVSEVGLNSITLEALDSWNTFAIAEIEKVKIESKNGAYKLSPVRKKCKECRC